MGSTLKAELTNRIVLIDLKREDVIPKMFLGSRHHILVSRIPFHNDLEVT